MPPPRPSKFCDFLRKVCRECGYEHEREYRGVACLGCGADRTCGRPVVKDFSQCQDHGGPNPNKGKFGMTSDLNKFPIVQLAERYRKMVSDGRVISLRASIAVVRGRIEQLARRIDVNDAPDRLQRLDDLWAEYTEAWRADRKSDMIVIMSQLDGEFKKAREDYSAWNQMMMALDLDRKLVESEIKVYKEMKAMLTAEDARELVAKLLAIVLRVFSSEKKKLEQVKYEFIRAIGERPIDVVPEDADEDVPDEEPLAGTDEPI